MDWLRRTNCLAATLTRHNPSSLFFFLVGFVKDVVYNTNVENLQDLCSRITDVCALVDTNMLSRTWHKLMYRLDVLRATNGAHIEVY